MRPSSSIPDNAVENVDRVESNGEQLCICLLDGHIVGRRIRTAAGALLQEHTEKDGIRDGYERQWDVDGNLEFETWYVGGLEHGTASQWHRGDLLGTYQMELGSGVDLWRNTDHSLSEERHVRSGQRDGFERWWNNNNKTVWQEGHFRAGLAHGIFRQWDVRGRLRRGYPHYFVGGQRVAKAAYLKVVASDPSLPDFLEAENAPGRVLPAEYLALSRSGGFSRSKLLRRLFIGRT